MSSVTSRRGGEPVGFGSTGLVEVSLSASRSAAGLGSSLVCVCLVEGGGEEDPPSSSSPPHAARADSASAAISRNRQSSERRTGGQPSRSTKALGATPNICHTL